MITEARNPDVVLAEAWSDMLQQTALSKAAVAYLTDDLADFIEQSEDVGKHRARRLCELYQRMEKRHGAVLARLTRMKVLLPSMAELIDDAVTHAAEADRLAKRMLGIARKIANVGEDLLPEGAVWELSALPGRVMAWNDLLRRDVIFKRQLAAMARSLLPVTDQELDVYLLEYAEIRSALKVSVTNIEAWKPTARRLHDEHFAAADEVIKKLQESTREGSDLIVLARPHTVDAGIAARQERLIAETA